MDTKTSNINHPHEEYKEGFHDPEVFVHKEKKGLNEEIIKNISKKKNEPKWMTDFRLESYKIFQKKPLPSWGPDISEIKLDDMYYYLKAVPKAERSWEDVPEDIKNTFNKLGIIEAEQKYLAGVGAQYDSEAVYHSLQKHLEKQGIIFLDTDTALQKYPEYFKEYFGTVVPKGDNAFAALNSAVWSGGSFIYVPKGVKAKLPLQAYFRINAENLGQFERTLIIADEGSEIHYVEGCTAPVYNTASLHSAVVEIIVKKNARVRYTTIQNWSKNVYNLVTKRAYAYENSVMEWVDGNLGSKATMKYPSVYLKGKGAKAEILSLAFAGEKQHQDTGGKVIHFAPNTSSRIISKSISKAGGRSSYRGLSHIQKKAKNSKNHVICDALILDKESISDTYPKINNATEDAKVEHEASVSKLDDKKLFYLMSRGLSEEEARGMLVNGFIEPIVKELPMEYALELNRLIELEMEGSVG